MTKLLLCILILIPIHAYAFDWPVNTVGAVSISADDGWVSQLQQADLLEQYGFRGTFYLSLTASPPIEQYKNSWRGVHQRGHEVGNHSYYHYSNLTTKTWQQVATSVGNMEWWLLTNIYSMIPTDHTYSYPYGKYIIGSQATNQYKQVGACEHAAVLSATVTGARLAGGSENIPEDVATRRYYLNSKSIYGSNALDTAIEQIDKAVENGTWVILSFHSFGDYGDGYYTGEGAYTQILEYLSNAPVWVAPVIEVKNYIIANTPSEDWNCKL